MSKTIDSFETYYKLHKINEKSPIVGGQTHLDILKLQLSEFKLSDKEQKIGQYIIGCVDDDGYMRRLVWI